jgi:uncharacterized protein (DUF58 family)
MQNNSQIKEILEYSHIYDRFELLAKQIVEGFITGLHRSPYHGFSVEFAEHRLYNSGESTKHIDWKLFARTDKLFVKKYEEETNLRTQLVIDCSSSMLFPFEDGKLNKLSYSALMSAALALLMRRQRDATGLTLFSGEITKHLPAKLAPVHIQALMSALAELTLIDKPDKELLNKKNSTPAVLHQIAESIHKRSLVIIFSDLLDSASSDEMFAALQHLKFNKHEVIIINVTDRSKELELDFGTRLTKFVDLETGSEIKLNPADAQKLYKEKAGSYFNELRLKCASYHIDFFEADISSGNYSKLLMEYLIKRNRLF